MLLENPSRKACILRPGMRFFSGEPSSKRDWANFEEQLGGIPCEHLATLLLRTVIYSSDTRLNPTFTTETATIVMKLQMLSIWTLLATAICAVSVSAISQRIVIHGQHLTLELPERTKKLEFVSSDESEAFTIWEHSSFSFQSGKASKGEVSSNSKGWTFRIRHVTFDDQGSYTLYSHFGSSISSYIVKVKSNREVIDRVAGETLRISLAGLKQSDATLHFYSNYSSVTLVENGVPVGRNHPDYVNRLSVNSGIIQILNVNTSDLGRYELTDLKGRLVSNNTMILVEKHDYNPNKGLIALLLLGIPGGICFCCRKRICKRCRKSKSYTQEGQSNSSPVSIPCSNTVTVPIGPVGPGDPGQGYVAGYPNQGQNYYPYPTDSSGQPAVPPNPGFYSEFAPQNPVYPPDFGPGGPPAQPTPWNAPPPQYNPSAPVNYNVPVMNSAPTGPEPTGMNMNQQPPTAPLLTPQPELQPSVLMPTDILNSSDTGVQFDVNKGKSSGSNFL